MTFPLLAKPRWILLTVWLALHMKLVHGGSITYQWSQTPLHLELKVGVEQNIHIPQATRLQIGVPNEVAQQIETQIIDNHLWLTAKEEFSSTRLLLIAEPLGKQILEVQSNHYAVNLGPVVISKDSNKSTDNSRQNSDAQHGFISLTRWVVQQLYAPKRLLTKLPGVTQVAVNRAKINLFRCGARIPTLCGNALLSSPMASWKSPNHFITAVHVKNNLDEPVTLDPRELIGSWRTASFVHTKLSPSGQINDSTVLVLISDKPFTDAIGFQS